MTKLNELLFPPHKSERLEILRGTMNIAQAKRRLKHPKFGDEKAIEAAKYACKVMEAVEIIKLHAKPDDWDMCFCGQCDEYVDFNEYVSYGYLGDFSSSILSDAERILRGEIKL